jgi:hypothetical protein
VLRLWDARASSYAMLASPRAPLRVCVHGPAGGTSSGLAGLRVPLVADVLTRIAELQGLETITVLAADSAPPAGLDEDLSAPGIHPPPRWPATRTQAQCWAGQPMCTWPGTRADPATAGMGASQPSRPIPAQAASMIGHAFDDDLDTAAPAHGNARSADDRGSATGMVVRPTAYLLAFPRSAVT